jgi:hypothetical protein
VELVDVVNARETNHLQILHYIEVLGQRRLFPVEIVRKTSKILLKVELGVENEYRHVEEKPSIGLIRNRSFHLPVLLRNDDLLDPETFSGVLLRFYLSCDWSGEEFDILMVLPGVELVDVVRAGQNHVRSYQRPSSDAENHLVDRHLFADHQSH